jgi:hypothetical protein
MRLLEGFLQKILLNAKWFDKMSSIILSDLRLNSRTSSSDILKRSGSILRKNIFKDSAFGSWLA